MASQKCFLPELDMLLSVFARLHANYYLATAWTSRMRVTRILISPACGMLFLTFRCTAGCLPLRFMGMRRCKQPELLTLFMPLPHLSKSTKVIPRFPSRPFVALSVPVRAQLMRIDAQSFSGASLNPSPDPPPAGSQCLFTLWTHVARPIQKVALQVFSQAMF